MKKEFGLPPQGQEKSQKEDIIGLVPEAAAELQAAQALEQYIMLHFAAGRFTFKELEKSLKANVEYGKDAQSEAVKAFNRLLGAEAGNRLGHAVEDGIDYYYLKASA